MSFKSLRRLYGELVCDHPGCVEAFEREAGETVARARGRARLAGWKCQNSGPRTPASDLCPEHAGASS